MSIVWFCDIMLNHDQSTQGKKKLHTEQMI